MINFIELFPAWTQQAYVGAAPALAHFRFPYSFPQSGLTVSLLGLSGAAAMYVGNDLGNATRSPTPGVPSSYLFGPITAGSVLTIPPAAANASFPAGSVPTAYFFTVVSQDVDGAPAGGALFTLTVSLLNNNTNPPLYPTLTLGVAVLGTVASGGFNRYQLVWPSAGVKTINVLLDGQTGYPGLYALLQGSPGRPNRGVVSNNNAGERGDRVVARDLRGVCGRARERVGVLARWCRRPPFLLPSPLAAQTTAATGPPTWRCFK